MKSFFTMLVFSAVLMFRSSLIGSGLPVDNAIFVPHDGICPRGFSGYGCVICQDGKPCTRFCSKKYLCNGPGDRSCLCEEIVVGDVQRMTAKRMYEMEKNIGRRTRMATVARSYNCPERFNGWACIKCTSSGCTRFCSRTYACNGFNDPQCNCEAVRGRTILWCWSKYFSMAWVHPDERWWPVRIDACHLL